MKLSTIAIAAAVVGAGFLAWRRFRPLNGASSLPPDAGGGVHAIDGVKVSGTADETGPSGHTDNGLGHVDVSGTVKPTFISRAAQTVLNPPYVNGSR